MQFNKSATLVKDQLSILKSRGLLFEDENRCIQILKNNNYYRLGEYFYNFQYDKSNHLYISGITFENIYSTYLFDCELRKLIFNYIAEIEVSLRTKLIYYLSNEVDPWWFLDPKIFIHNINPRVGISYANGTIKKIHETIKVSKNKEIPLKTHYKKYNTDKRLPPAWKTLEYCTFGIISNLYKNLNSSTKSRQSIANDYDLNFVVLNNWIECLNDLRNFCAHHSRLYNRNLPKYGLLLTNTNSCWVNDKGFNTNSLYYNLCIIRYLMNAINPFNKMNIELVELIKKYSEINLQYLGFTNKWENEDLWKIISDKKKSKFIKDTNSTNNKVKVTLKT